MAYSADLTSAAAGSTVGTTLIFGVRLVQRGTWVVLAMLVLGLALAGLAIGVRYRAGDRVLEYWTPPVALLIADAPNVELWELAATPTEKAPTRPPVLIHGTPWHVAGTRDLSRAAGFSHARQALLEDAGYDWAQGPDPAAKTWQYALHFENQGNQAVVLLDLEGARAALVGRNDPVSIAPLAPRLRIFLDDVRSMP
jgi:hypothetical protein